MALRLGAGGTSVGGELGVAAGVAFELNGTGAASAAGVVTAGLLVAVAAGAVAGVLSTAGAVAVVGALAAAVAAAGALGAVAAARLLGAAFAGLFGAVAVVSANTLALIMVLARAAIGSNFMYLSHGLDAKTRLS